MKKRKFKQYLGLYVLILPAIIYVLIFSYGQMYGMVTGKPDNLLTFPKLFNDIYVWSGVWQNVGWGTIVYLAALAGESTALRPCAAAII